jgi:hypothetical protein
MPIVPTDNNADIDPKDGLPRKDASGMREAELHLQLQVHGDRDQKRTILGSLVNHIYDGDSRSKANLEALSDQMKEARLSGDDTRYRETAAKVATALKEDREAMWTSDTVTGVGTGAIKAAGLFMTVAATHGKALWASGATTAALYGLDQAKSNDTAANQIVDFGLGSLKGVATAATFRALGNLDPRSHVEAGAKLTAWESIAANPLTRGVAYGTTGRFLDLGLSRQTYENHSTGSGFDLAHGVGQTLTGTFMSRAMIADGLLFGASSKLSGSLQGGLESNAMLRTMTTSSMFGLSSGLYSEFSNQQKTGEYNVGRLVTRGVAQAVADGLAGAPAGRYSAALQGALDGNAGTAGTVKLTEPVESTKPRLIATAPRETGLPKTGALDPTSEPGRAAPQAPTAAAERAERAPQQPALEAPHQVRPAVEKSDAGSPAADKPADRVSAESQDLNAGARIIDKPNGDRLIIRTNGDRVLEKPGQPRTTYKPDGRVIVEEENGRVTEYRSRANTPLED